MLFTAFLEFIIIAQFGVASAYNNNNNNNNNYKKTRNRKIP